ncbi:hypothetical protein J5N97_000450 [Dioscorea zingiberensis]|uniref:Uncharacterized protein n=1 Tax=Dioscorea zingiberensis TaxID=325984 RepID=A0A9D5H1E0_9LILI|nr:hypothetical protein J5N97_000450 [Dioscorea zingiberensis]
MHEELEEFREYYDDDQGDDNLDEAYYFRSSSNIRVGNRRWGDNGYVRAGRQEARPVVRQPIVDSGAGPSQVPKKKEAAKDVLGRRAKRALKREAADKAAAAKHQQHLQRLGRKMETVSNRNTSDCPEVQKRTLPCYGLNLSGHIEVVRVLIQGETCLSVLNR